MLRMTWLPLGAQVIGSAVVLALFVARGFVLHQHTRIMLGALVLIWLVGVAWTLATAAEETGGLRRMGPGGVLVVILASLAAVAAPAVALWMMGR